MALGRFDNVRVTDTDITPLAAAAAITIVIF
jgi:hypothetical protein